MILKPHEINELDTQVQNDTACTKVLHLINGEHFSGAERVQDLLAMQLPAFGYEVGFACLKPEKFPKVRQSQEDAELFEVGMRSKLDWRAIRKIANVVTDGDFEIIHAHTPRSLLIGGMVAKRTNCPLIYHVHSPVGRDSSRKFHNFVNTMMEKWSLKHVQKMICVSNSLLGYMKEIGHPEEKLRVVQNGVPIVEDLPSRSAPSSPWTIGTMALFRPRKGTEVLLDAMAELKLRGCDIQLRAVGPFETPEYKTEILYRAQKLGLQDSITWTGFKKDINHQLEQMDLFVLPSLYGEGLPMVVLESMACGVPVVASRVEGIPEAIRDEVDGLIFEPGDASDLADKLQALIESKDRWQPMSQSALQRQRDHLSDVNMAQKVAAVYDELL
ncbi:glycosyltransferase [bacterium]|nr:glycosyltransferase [bacterium]